MKYSVEEILEAQEKIKSKLKLVNDILIALYDALESGETAIKTVKKKIAEYTEYKNKLDEQMELFNNTLKEI